MGGWAVVEVEERHHQVLGVVHHGINQHLGSNHQTFTIIEVRHQIVAGTNYQFIVETEDHKRIQVKVFEPLPHTNQPAHVTAAVYL
ncbi:unnamed protein product [Paramecium primaurelia]|uniref:Cystatin domain-containing protein n=1 Tax=Paramecium primaurelia TaxID=5886 RepID=A0A8S1NUT3_PARPR|nr:unnamed protein product [Paramecium primaurelia]